MTDKLDQLERIARLLDEGSISEEEYEVLKTHAVKAGVVTEQGGESSPEDAGRGPAPTSQPDRHQTRLIGEPASPIMRILADLGRNDSPDGRAAAIYKVAFGLGVASVFFGGTMGLLAWVTVGVSGWALHSTKEERSRWMPWTGLILGIVFSFMNLYVNGHLNQLFAESDQAQDVQNTVPSPVPSTPPTSPIQTAPPTTEPELTWSVGACASQGPNRLLWGLTPCSSPLVGAIVIATPLLSSDCPPETDFYVEPSGIRVACMMEYDGSP